MKIPKNERRALIGIWIIAYLSGAGLFVLNQWIRVPSAIGELHHPMEHWSRLIHSGLSYATILSVGYLIKGHILPGIKSTQKKRIYSGVGMLGLFTLLTVTALATLYGSESVSTHLASQIHSLIGVLSPCLLLLHGKNRTKQVRSERA